MKTTGTKKAKKNILKNNNHIPVIRKNAQMFSEGFVSESQPSYEPYWRKHVEELPDAVIRLEKIIAKGRKILGLNKNDFRVLVEAIVAEEERNDRTDTVKRILSRHPEYSAKTNSDKLVGKVHHKAS